MATLKPTTPLHAPNRGALKPASPLHPTTAAKTPISHPQRRRRFQLRLGRHPQRRQGFQSHTSTSEQRRWRFQTTAHLAGLRDDAPSHTSATRPHWCGGRRRVRRARAGFEAGPGCGARGRWRGLAGLRDDAPSEARGADGSRAGRRPRAHRAARPRSRALRRPEHPWGHKQQPGKTKTADPERICGFIVREGGVEPPLHHWNTDLNRARLPIPPLARTQKE